MRLYSTPESAERGEITVLGIGETLVAMGVSLWLAAYLGSVRHIAIGGAAVLFMLFRTPRSVELGLRYISDKGMARQVMLVPHKIVNRQTQLTEPVRKLARIVAWGATLVLIAPVIFVTRVGVTIAGAISSPGVALASVPANWNRIVLCTDACHPPEPIPGVETTESGYEEFRLKEWVPNATQSVAFFATFIVLFVPPYVFRLLLKATCFVHLPLLLVVRSRFGESLSVEERLTDIRFGEDERFRRSYGIVVILLMFAATASTVLADAYPALLAGLHPNVAQAFREVYIPVEGREITLKGWHAARVANVVIACWLYFYADRAVRRLKSGNWRGQSVTRTLDVARVIQTVLAAYTIYCSLAIFIYYGLQFELPAFGLELFPTWE